MKHNMAYYDPVTDTIANCKPNTYAWYHEQRHRVQYKKSPFGDITDYIGMLSYTVSFIVFINMLWTSAYLQGFIIMGILVTPYILMCAALEMDAHIFGAII